MADTQKVLNTRIINKHATLEAWQSSSLVLKEGEIALAAVNTTRPDGQGGTITVPTYLMKVGDGTNTFSQLNWLAAPASDVYAWAKKANLEVADIPVLTANKIPNLDISKITGLETRLSNLEAAVGTGGSVDTKIQNAINALDVDASTDANGVVIASISETDGKISVTRRALAAADIPELEISKIKDLQTTLNGKVDSSTYSSDKATIESNIQANSAALTKLNGAESVTDSVRNIAKSYADGKDAAIKAAKDAADAAQKDVDTLEGTVNTLSGTVSSNYSTLDTKISNEATARADADKALEDSLNDLKDAIGNLSNIMNFRGAVASKDQITDPVNGDVIAVIEGDDAGKEFVYDSSRPEGQKWVEFGSVSAQDAAIASLKSRMDTAEQDIDAVEGKLAVIQGTGDGSIAKALADAKSYADQAEADAISAVQGKDSDTASSATVAGAKKYADSKVQELSDGQVKENKTAISGLDTRLGSAESKLATIQGADTVEGSIAKALKDANAHADQVAAAAVSAVQGTDADTKDSATVIGAKKYADDKVTALANGQVTTNKNAIDTLSSKVSTIEGNYVKISGTNLVDQAGTVIIFDCGGAE